MDYIVNDTALTATADAIREKTGTTDPITWLEELGFSEAIAAIETGGGDYGKFSITVGTVTFAESTKTFDTQVACDSNDNFVFGLFRSETEAFNAKGCCHGFAAVYDGNPNNRVACELVSYADYDITGFPASNFANGTFTITTSYPFLVGTNFTWLLGVIAK